MTRRMLLWLAAAAFAAVSFHDVGHAQSPAGSELQRVDFAVGDISYQILVPVGSRLDGSARPGCAKIWHPRSARQMNFFELCSSTGAAAGPYARQVHLTNGALLRYSIESDLEGGSGGTEAGLEGRLDFNGTVLALTCRDQSEWSADPRWCMDYLGYLTVGERK